MMILYLHHLLTRVECTSLLFKRSSVIVHVLVCKNCLLLAQSDEDEDEPLPLVIRSSCPGCSGALVLILFFLAMD